MTGSSANDDATPRSSVLIAPDEPVDAPNPGWPAPDGAAPGAAGPWRAEPASALRGGPGCGWPPGTR